MRGKDKLRNREHIRHRITPACAGKSRPVPAPPAQRRDHPRVCGEKGKNILDGITSKGSPPRVRGKVAPGTGTGHGQGITPACAGKSECERLQGFPDKDHPRVCGEKRLGFDDNRSVLGSPPRVRGKVKGILGIRNENGITPACAGKRLKRSHSIGHFSCILCLFHSVLHRASVSGGSRAGPCAPPCLPAQNAVPV